MVQDVLASAKDIEVTVAELDTEEGEELDGELRKSNGIPSFQVY